MSTPTTPPTPTTPTPAPLFTTESGADTPIRQQADQPSPAGTRPPVRSRGHAAASAETDDITDARARELSDEARRYRLRAADLREQLASTRQQLEHERAARQQAEQHAQQTQAEAARVQALTEIAHRHGLPPELATRLQGATPDEIEADAKALAALIVAPRPPTVPRPVNIGLVGDAPPASRANLLVGIARHGRATPNPFRGGDES